MSPSEFDDAYSVSPAAMSDEQIALRDAMTVTAVDQAESIAALSASLHAHLDGLCKSVERLERERDEMRTVLAQVADATYGKIKLELWQHANRLAGDAS